MKTKNRICIAALTSLSIVAPMAIQAEAPEGKSPLSPGPVADKTVYLEKAHGYPFAEFEVIMGTPPNLVVQVYNTSGATDFTDSVSDKFNAMDAKALAIEVGADVIVKNPRRWWIMDQMWSYGAGETHDFDGIKATWMAKIALGADSVKKARHSLPTKRVLSPATLSIYGRKAPRSICSARRMVIPGSCKLSPIWWTRP
jgi:hypothetical protein